MKEITITIRYDEEDKDASINMSTGPYNNTDYGYCDTAKEVKEAIVYAAQEIEEMVKKYGMK